MNVRESAIKKGAHTRLAHREKNTQFKSNQITDKEYSRY